MKEKNLESESNAPNPLYFEIGQTKYTIHPHHVDFFEKLRVLPVKHRIKLLGLEIEQMQAYIAEEKLHASVRVKNLLSKTWYWKDTGDVVDIHIDTIPGVPYTVKEMQAKNRSLEILLRIVDFFEGENREVYAKED